MRFVRKPNSDRVYANGVERQAWMDTEQKIVYYCEPDETYAVYRWDTCNECRGTGYCRHCEGGIFEHVYSAETGHMEPVTCPFCKGSSYCDYCGGDGKAIYPTKKEEPMLNLQQADCYKIADHHEELTDAYMCLCLQTDPITRRDLTNALHRLVDGDVWYFNPLDSRWYWGPDQALAGIPMTRLLNQWSAVMYADDGLLTIEAILAFLREMAEAYDSPAYFASWEREQLEQFVLLTSRLVIHATRVLKEKKEAHQ